MKSGYKVDLLYFFKVDIYMSFRQYGGINYAARNNIVKNNYSNANNLSVMTKVGQPSSYINFESDISANIIYSDLNVNNLTVKYNSTLKGNLDVSGNSTLRGTLTVGPTNGPNGIMYIIDNITTPKATLRIIASNFDGANFIQSGINKTDYSTADLRFTDMNAKNTWMTIQAGGNVGIGTTAPNGKLDVRGNMYIKPTVTTSISSPAFKIELNGANCIIYKSTTSSDTVIQNNGGGSLKLMSDNGDGVYISGNGPFVGINTISPNSALDVNGDALINGLTVGQGVTTNSCNTVLGLGALVNSNSGYNTAIGYNTLAANASGSKNNTAVGYFALNRNTNVQNTAVGSYSLQANTGYDNTAVGYLSMYTNNAGFSNTAFGTKSLYNQLTSGTTDASGNWLDNGNNTAIGGAALYWNNGIKTNTPNVRSGAFNTAVGVNALRYNTTGYYNTAVGLQAGCNFGSTTNPDNYTSGGPNTANGCTFLGAESRCSSVSLNPSNSTAIGYNSVISASNQIMMGTSNETVYIPGGLQYNCLNTINTGGNLYFPIAPFYFVNNTTAINIILPIPLSNGASNGTTVSFRRYSNNAYDIYIYGGGNTTSSNIVGHNSLTPSVNVILNNSVFGCTLTVLNANWYITTWLT